MKSPITRSGMRSVLEKQIVRRTKRLIPVRKLMCLISIFCVWSLPTPPPRAGKQLRRGSVVGSQRRHDVLGHQVERASRLGGTQVAPVKAEHYRIDVHATIAL